MRFAYIDSQGNEVAIPSVDALALRIELGAIGPETELYDAHADRWGPARTHEIFHTLSRESEDDGFVAPPPPVAQEPEEPTAPGADAGAEDALEPEPEPEPEVEEPAAPDPPAGTPAAGEGGLGFDLTLADDETGDAGPEAPEPATTEDAGTEEPGAAPMEFGLVDEGPLAEPPAAEEDAADGGGAEEAAFDFGGMDVLEVEEPAREEEAGEPAMEFGGGMELEEPLSEQDDFSGVEESSGDLDLEEPMSEFSSDAPPAWMEQDGPAANVFEDDDDDEGMLDFGAPSDEDDDEPMGRGTGFEEEVQEPEERAEPRREPRSRPSPPRRKPERSFAGPLLGIVLVAVLGVGGWFGWRAMQSGSGETGPAPLPPVTIPDIPAELLPTMRDLGEEALAATVAEMESMAEESGLPAEPRQDWLSGAYMANASDFTDVQEYWLGIESFVEGVRERDTAIFHEKYAEALARAGISGDTAAILQERADSGFLATRDDRIAAYAEMGDLIDASLALHDFLLTNEEEIDYDPAAGGMSADPVLEAVPSSRELGDEMWDRVDRITGALDQLGTLDRVTTERLMAVLFDRIRRAGFQ